jgi:hypothetical protein
VAIAVMALIAAGAAVVGVTRAVTGACVASVIGVQVHSYHYQASPEPPRDPNGGTLQAADVTTWPVLAVRWKDDYSGRTEVVIGSRRYVPQQEEGEWTVGEVDRSPLPLSNFWSGLQVGSVDRISGGGCHLTGHQGNKPVELWIGSDGLPARAIVTYPPCDHKGCPPSPQKVTYTYSQVNRLPAITPPPSVWQGGKSGGGVGQRIATADGGAVTVRSAWLAEGPPDPSLPALPAGRGYVVVDIVLENTAHRSMPYWVAGIGRPIRQSGLAPIDGGCYCVRGRLAPQSTTPGQLVLVADSPGGSALTVSLGYAQVSVLLNVLLPGQLTGKVGQPLSARDMTVTVTAFDPNGTVTRDCWPDNVGSPPLGQAAAVVHLSVQTAPGIGLDEQHWSIHASDFQRDMFTVPQGGDLWCAVALKGGSTMSYPTLWGKIGINSFLINLG